MKETHGMSTTFNLRERQAPLKERFTTDPSSAQATMTVRSTTAPSVDPTRVRIASDAGGGTVWDVGAHELAGGEGDLACSGDVFLASLAACQEITIRMVAAAMRIELRHLELTVEGDMDFRGTMGVDPDVPVGFQAIRVNVLIDTDAPADRLERLMQRAERYCVVSATLKNPPVIDMSIAKAS
jgi:uncharacterized OsmC-like protein